MAYKTEKTVPIISVGADKEQQAPPVSMALKNEMGMPIAVYQILVELRTPFSTVGTAGVLSADDGATPYLACRLMSAEVATGDLYPSESPRYLYSRSAESVIMGNTLKKLCNRGSRKFANRKEVRTDGERKLLCCPCRNPYKSDGR